MPESKCRRVLIYQVVCGESDKCYIGVTSVSLRRRWQGHMQVANRGDKHALAAAIRKYGRAAFAMVHIATAFSREDAVHVEQRLILERGTKSPRGYNLTDGGDGVLGLPVEIRRSTAEKLRGRTHTKESKKLIGSASRGRPCSAETRALISAARSGQALTDAHRQKLSLAKLGKKRPPRTPEHSAKIAEGLRRAWARRKGCVE